MRKNINKCFWNCNFSFFLKIGRCIVVTHIFTLHGFFSCWPLCPPSSWRSPWWCLFLSDTRDMETIKRCRWMWCASYTRKHCWWKGFQTWRISLHGPVVIISWSKQSQIPLWWVFDQQEICSHSCTLPFWPDTHFKGNSQTTEWAQILKKQQL